MDGQPLDALIEENENEVSSDRDFLNSEDVSLAGAKFSIDQNTTVANTTEFTKETERRIQRNIDRGRVAISRILHNHDERPAAMHRDEIGDIDFIWGREGTRARNYEDGFGISKILLKHGRTAVDMIPQVIARGNITRQTDDKVIIEHEGYLSVIKLKWNNESKTWLVTNYDTTQEAPNFAGEDWRPANTTTRTSSSRVSASSSRSLPQSNDEGNSENTVTLGAGARFSRTGEDDTAVNSEDEPSLTPAQIDELFRGVNVVEEFSKLQDTMPINVSNELSQNTSRRNLIQAAKNAFSETYPDGVIVNTQIGEVKITRSSINDSLRHLLSRAKADSVISLPDGMENATYIGKLEDFDGNPITNYYFFYPINYEGRRYLVLCRVRKIGRAKNFYVHDVISYDEINERSSTLRPSVVNNEPTQTLRRTALYKAILTEFFRKGNSENTATLGEGAKFSIGSDDNSQSSNDNSNEGLFSKIKNLLTGRPNQSNERIRKRINTMLSKLAGVKIAAGHMNNGLDIVVKDVEKVIRTNRAYDWEHLLPAVGQKIATILKLNSTTEMGNYIADWLMTGALNNTSAAATQFATALRENPEIRENLLEIQSTFAEWRNMTPIEKVQATIEFEKPKPTVGERLKTAKDEGYQQFFEELEPVNDLVKEWEKITGEKLADAVNPYILLRNYRGIAGRAKLLIEGDTRQ